MAYGQDTPQMDKDMLLYQSLRAAKYSRMCYLTLDMCLAYSKF